MEEGIYEKELEKYKRFLVIRGKTEINYWKNQIELIKEYSQEQAIRELIAAKKLNEKIAVITSYIDKLKC